LQAGVGSLDSEREVGRIITIRALAPTVILALTLLSACATSGPKFTDITAEMTRTPNPGCTSERVVLNLLQLPLQYKTDNTLAVLPGIGV